MQLPWLGNAAHAPGLERAAECSRKEMLLPPLMSSKMIFWDDLPLFEKKCMDLLIECKY